MNNNYKLIRIPCPGGDIWELYDFKHNPSETINLMDSGLAVETLLKQKLNQWISTDSLSELNVSKPTPKNTDLQDKLRTLGYIQ